MHTFLTRILVTLLLMFFINADLTAQVPVGPEVLKAKRVRVIGAAGIGGTEYHLIDENGYLISQSYEDPTFTKADRSIARIFYNDRKQPDSILFKSRWSQWKEYFVYSANGTLHIVVEADNIDSTWIDKAGKKIKTKSTDGSSVRYEYNAARQLVKSVSIDPDGKKKEKIYKYNAAGQLIMEVYAWPGQRSTVKYTYKNGLPATQTTIYESGSEFVVQYSYQFY